MWNTHTISGPRFSLFHKLSVAFNLSEYSICYAHLNMMLHVNLLLGVQRATIQQTAARISYHMLWTAYEMKMLSSFIIYIECSQMLWFFLGLESKELGPDAVYQSRQGVGTRALINPTTCHQSLCLPTFAWRRQPFWKHFSLVSLYKQNIYNLQANRLTLLPETPLAGSTATFSSCRLPW